jgi:uncharacterized protein (UPF0264 family)
VTLRLLVSVRSVHEALAAAEAGAHFIDLKDPASGTLGGLPPRRIARIVQALRALAPGAPISATIGDVPAASLDEILRRVAAVSACGVDYVKVGIAPDAGLDAATALLDRLARCGTAVVPVLIADAGIDDRLVDAALGARTFPALMLDTVDKRGGSLLQRLPAVALAAFVDRTRSHGCLAGLAGALRACDVAALIALAPDFTGFRSAVCAGDRAGALDAGLVRDLARRLAARPGLPAIAAAAS